MGLRPTTSGYPAAAVARACGRSRCRTASTWAPRRDGSPGRAGSPGVTAAAAAAAVSGTPDAGAARCDDAPPPQPRRTDAGRDRRWKERQVGAVAAAAAEPPSLHVAATAAEPSRLRDAATSPSRTQRRQRSSGVIDDTGTPAPRNRPAAAPPRDGKAGGPPPPPPPPAPSPASVAPLQAADLLAPTPRRSAAVAAAGGTVAVSELKAGDVGPHRHFIRATDGIGEALAVARRAALSRDPRVRRQIGAQLLAWLRPQTPAPPPGDEDSAAAAGAGGAIPAAAAVELAVVCPDLFITDKAVWDRLLWSVADAAAAAAAEAGVTHGSVACPAAAERPPEAAARSAWAAWELALVLRAAAACGQADTNSPQLFLLRQSLSRILHRGLLPQSQPSLLTALSLAAPLRSAPAEGRQGLSRTRQSGPEEELIRQVAAADTGGGGGPVTDAGTGGSWGRDGGQGREEAGRGLLALLHAAGELTRPPTQTPPVAATRPAEAQANPEPAAAAILERAGVVEAALRELLACTPAARPGREVKAPTAALPGGGGGGGDSSLPTRGPAPSGEIDGGILTHSRLGAAASLRAALTAWRLLLAADGGPRRPDDEAAAARTAATGAGAPRAAAAAAVEVDGELVQQLVRFVRCLADRLLPEARGSSGGDGGSGGSGNDLRVVLRGMSMAWRSWPDLHRHPGLSRSVWEALRATAALAAAPADPWVIDGPRSGSPRVVCETASAAAATAADTLSDGAAVAWGRDGGCTAAVAAATLPSAAAAAAADVLLLDMCRLAAATFYTRAESSGSDVDVSDGDAASDGLHGRKRRRRYLIGGGGADGNSSAGGDSPNADDLLLLVRTVEGLRRKADRAASVTAATTGHLRSAAASGGDACGGAGTPRFRRGLTELESIVQASASAYLRYATGPAAAAEDGDTPLAASSLPWEASGSGAVLGLTASVVLTEYLARSSRVPDWHLLWRLMRSHAAAAAADPAPCTDPGGGGSDAAALGARGAAAAAVAVADRVLRSSDAELRRWCWPRTAVRLAEALAEAAGLAADGGVAAAAASGGDGGSAANAAAAAMEAAAERLLLHTATAAVDLEEPDLAEALTWLRSAAVLEGGRHRRSGGAAAAAQQAWDHVSEWQRPADDGARGNGGCADGLGDRGDGPLAAELERVAAHSETLLLRQQQYQRQEHYHRQSRGRARTVATDDGGGGGGDGWEAAIGDSGGRSSGTVGSGLLDAASGAVASGGSNSNSRRRAGGDGGAALRAIGQLLEADAEAPEGCSCLPPALLDACVEMIAAAAAGAKNGAAGASAERLRAAPWGGFQASARAGPAAAIHAGGDGGGAAEDGVLWVAAAQALGWLAARRVVPDGHLLLPLLDAVAGPAAGAAVGRPRGADPWVSAGGADPRVNAGGERHVQLQLQLQHVAAATLAVATLADTAAEAEADVASQLYDAARRLATSLRRMPSDRPLPLPQLAALCSALRRLGALDPPLLLHLTHHQRNRQRRRQPLARPLPFTSAAAAAAAAGGPTRRSLGRSNGELQHGPAAASAAAAAARLLPLVATVLLRPAPNSAAAAGPLFPSSVGATDAPAGLVEYTFRGFGGGPGVADGGGGGGSPDGGLAAAAAAADLAAWLAAVLSRGVEAVPPAALLSAWCAAQDIAAIVTDSGGGDGGGDGGGGGGGGVVRSAAATAAEGWLGELRASATRRLLATGVDGLLLHQLAALMRCLEPPQQHNRRNRHKHRNRSDSPEPDSQPAAAAAEATAAAAAAAAAVQCGRPGEVQHAGSWFQRWLRPDLPWAAPPGRSDGTSADPSDGLQGRWEKEGEEEGEVAVAVAPLLDGREAPSPLSPPRPPPPLFSDATSPQIQPAVDEEVAAAAEEEQQQQRRLSQQVLGALLCRTTRGGDAYEAPADVVAAALRDLAAAGALRASPPLAASLVDGLVFRIADDASVDGLAAVAAALAAGGGGGAAAATDPWVGHCEARGLLDELASGLQRRLRLQPETVTTEHLTAMASYMYDVATAVGGVGGGGVGNLPGCGGVLRALSRGLAARAEQLSPAQAMGVAAVFSEPRLRDMHLLQRLTAAVAVVSGQPYTAEQLLRLAQTLYSAGLRDQQLFAPLATALRARAETEEAAPSGGATTAAAIAAAAASGGGGVGGGLDTRTLQAAISLLRGVRLYADAEALQQVFVAQMRCAQAPPAGRRRRDLAA
ncbi:hypothetical protein PLESTM_001705800 [Pleodorina starrii]|nr:hypothetical protein PLESTM_001705800 [Pleodorina starrii]